MEYPIIDSLTNAYLQNGWSGLELITGKNILDSSNVINGYLSPTIGASINNVVASTRYSHTDPVDASKGLSISVKSNNLNTYGIGWIILYNNDVVVQTYSPFFSTTDQVLTYAIPANTYEKMCMGFGAASGYDTGTDIDGEIMVVEGTTLYPYEPYEIKGTDINNRLPLPMIKCYPLYDSLQRAAAGTQTADDTEILRHYLAPLGIGGI